MTQISSTRFGSLRTGVIKVSGSPHHRASPFSNSELWPMMWKWNFIHLFLYLFIHLFGDFILCFWLFSIYFRQCKVILFFDASTSCSMRCFFNFELHFGQHPGWWKLSWLSTSYCSSNELVVFYKTHHKYGSECFGWFNSLLLSIRSSYQWKHIVS